ncbi:conserved hypothetical protein [Talaromyces stipitatus ATCC 10500]|uniref:Zn(2)-C6 fungal-type domain-containing protein n=1 Tax=Talaromyces stipitatus (strain ATCC 10500 / CBS 375.48 / QM 6759 / NRRL 1006) TaxID=441959 RepID=B8LWW5_TALSN|nr:uncharacterized protein TSTA_079530 [Talaromyces stipitatus ATCC 10500]EED24598.1 conserved hypothetical protein [Talaromyces stipitatus ATCC 10500]
MPNISASKKALVGRPCLTCQRRKIKCDRAKPDCHRCQKAGLQCGGYASDSFVLVVPTRISGEGANKVRLRRTKGKENVKSTIVQEDDNGTVDGRSGGTVQVPGTSPQSYINTAPENRMQVLSYFLERYLPASMTSHRNFITPSSWVRSLPNLLGRWEVLDTALSALCLAYIGDLHQGYVHLHESQRFYNEALLRLRSMSLDSLKSANEGVLTMTMTMAMYELFHSTYGRLQGWMFHVKGACRILQLRGPPTKDTPLDMSLFNRVRNTALWDAYGSRKMLFLARPEWQNLSDTPHDILLDALVCIPGLIEASDNMLSLTQSGRVDLPGIDDLLRCWHAIYLRLTEWYVEFEKQEPVGLYDCGPLDRKGHPYLDADKSHLYSMFPQVISFRDTYVAQNLLMYWFGQLVVHTTMLQLYVSREKHQNRLNPDAFPGNYKGIHSISRGNVQKAGDYYATKICQSTANLRGGYGFQIVMVPLWAAQQFYDICQDPRYEWCQTVLRNFGAVGGYVLSAETLGFLRPAQYPGITMKGGDMVINSI